MKLRIKGNSIRYRLTKTEVANFAIHKYLEEKVEFGNNDLIYSLESSSAIQELSTSFVNNKIVVSIPDNLSKEWTGSEMVGMQNEFKLSNGKYMFILVEKDFVCLDNTFEDQSDNYPHPMGEEHKC
jgi:hypothetical protein